MITTVTTTAAAGVAVPLTMLDVGAATFDADGLTGNFFDVNGILPG